MNEKTGMNNGINLNNNIILNSNININPNLNKNSNSDKISTRDKINLINNKDLNLNDNNNSNINIINKNNLNNNKNNKCQEENLLRSLTTIGFDIQKNKYSNNDTNYNIGKNNDKNGNINQGVFDNILTPLKKFGNFLKKEEKKEISQDSNSKTMQKTIEKQEIFIRKDSLMERKAVMIKNVNNSLSSQGSPFGVTLKKIGSIK